MMMADTGALQQQQQREHPKWVEARVKYLARNSGEGESSLSSAAYHASEAGTRDGGTHEGNYEYHNIKINNARASPSVFDIDKQGFQLVTHPTNVQNFYCKDDDDEDFTKVYNLEIESLLLKQIPDAKSIVIFDHTKRSSSSQQRQVLHCREPSTVIHNDYTEWSANKRLHDMLGESKASEIINGKKRYAIVNVWRPISDTATESRNNATGSSDSNDVVENWPLTFCDSTTLYTNIDQDIVSVKRIHKDRPGEIQMAYYNPNHCWYYFPHMKLFDEILVFKTYDSVKNDDNAIGNTVNRFTLHTSFDDPTAYTKKSGSTDEPAPRKSIETRAFVFY